MSSTNEGSPPPSPAPAGAVSPTDPERPRWWADHIRQWTQKLRPSSSLRSNLADALDVEDGSETEQPDFSPAEREMLKNILELRETRIDDVMMPRADITAVPSDISLGKLLLAFQEAEHSRLPVYDETLDDPRGLVHIKDLMRYITGQSCPVADDCAGATAAQLDLGKVDLMAPLSSLPLIRPIIYAPPSMPAMELLARMQTSHQHMALVIDEHGGTYGLVTIEDLVETVVGDIADEHDEDEGPVVLRTFDGAYAVDARADLEDVFDELGIKFDLEELDEEVDTLGGLVTMLAGRVPVSGEVIEGTLPPDLKLSFEVLEADPRRVKRVKLRIVSPDDASDEDGPLPLSELPAARLGTTG
jgi:CBS domain containing-hemolysin-like protein